MADDRSPTTDDSPPPAGERDDREERHRGSLRALAWNERERRLRAPWRLVLGTALVFFAAVGGVLAAAGLAALAPSTASPRLVAVVSVTARLLQVSGFVAGVLLAASLLDRRRLADLGLGLSRAWWADLGFGLALGVALAGLVFALELAAGFLRVTGTVVSRADASLAIAPEVGAPLAFALTLAYFVGAGAFEELVFRGYLLTNVAEGLSGWRGIGPRGALAVAVLVSSLAFGVGHGLNPNVTPLALANIALFGGLFAASYLLTERIAAAVGLHVTWNVAIASVFGFPVSGFSTPVTLVAVEQSGPALLTGGGFGPEGGLVALVALAAGVGALVGWVQLREGGLRWRTAVARPSLRGGGGDDGRPGGERGREESAPE